MLTFAPYAHAHSTRSAQRSMIFLRFEIFREVRGCCARNHYLYTHARARTAYVYTHTHAHTHTHTHSQRLQKIPEEARVANVLLMCC